MQTIKIVTEINAPQDRVFNLSRSIDLHVESAGHTKEKAIDGITTGLIDLGQSVTWKAYHFGIPFKLTSKITKLEFPNLFQDVMVNGPFKFMEHDHLFQTKKEAKTIMIDIFRFQSPFGMLGNVIDLFVLKTYLSKFLEKRNSVIKSIAESEDYKRFLR